MTPAGGSDASASVGSSVQPPLAGGVRRREGGSAPLPALLRPRSPVRRRGDQHLRHSSRRRPPRVFERPTTASRTRWPRYPASLECRRSLSAVRTSRQGAAAPAPGSAARRRSCRRPHGRARRRHRCRRWPRRPEVTVDHLGAGVGDGDEVAGEVAVVHCGHVLRLQPLDSARVVPVGEVVAKPLESSNRGQRRLESFDGLQRPDPTGVLGAHGGRRYIPMFVGTCDARPTVWGHPGSRPEEGNGRPARRTSRRTATSAGRAGGTLDVAIGESLRG